MENTKKKYYPPQGTMMQQNFKRLEDFFTQSFNRHLNA